MLGYLSTDIVWSEKQECSSKKTLSFEAMVFWSVLPDYLNSLARNDSTFYIKVIRWLITQKTYLHCQKPKKNGLSVTRISEYW